MRVEEIDPNDEVVLAQLFGPFEASAEQDWGDDSGWTLREMREIVSGRDTSRRSVPTVVRDARGVVVGGAVMTLPLSDNLHVVNVQLHVYPDRRREGAGSALLDYVEDYTKTIGRTKVVAMFDSPVDAYDASPGCRFAERFGYREALTDARRELSLPPRAGLLDDLEAECSPYATGYEMTTWIGRCPNELVERRLALARAMSTDTPQGDLDMEPEVWDEERLRSWDGSLEAMGRTMLVAVALSKSTGELVGITDISVRSPEEGRPAPQTAFQFDTIVLRAHRGHRLGLLLKIANLRQIANTFPETRRILTWNATDNAAMIRVNEALGCVVTGRGSAWQKELIQADHSAKSG